MSKDKIPVVEYFSVPIKQAGKINWLDHCHGSEVRALQSYAEKVTEENEDLLTEIKMMNVLRGEVFTLRNELERSEERLKKRADHVVELEKERDRAVEALSILLRWNEDPGETPEGFDGVIDKALEVYLDITGDKFYQGMFLDKLKEN